MQHPTKFKKGDVVFTNVQVQSKQATRTVKKLAYIRRGPYEIIKAYPSGSYELKQLTSKTKNKIKKHGSDFYLCPEQIIPYKPVNTSDQLYSELNKPTTDNPYEKAHIQGYAPSSPWAAPAAYAHITNYDDKHFPTVEEMYTEFDSWPEPNTEIDTSTKELDTTIATMASSKDDCDQVISMPTTRAYYKSNISSNFATTIKQILNSTAKLFFIAYNLPNERRKEWKMVAVDLTTTLQVHPQCLQDGKFIVNFYIQHPLDDKLRADEQRYWVEYHQTQICCQ